MQLKNQQKKRNSRNLQHSARNNKVCRYTYSNKLANARRYNIKTNYLKDAEKDIKEQVVADIQRNERVAFEMNAGYNGSDNGLKQSSDNCVKTSVSENEYNILEDR